MKKTLLLLVSIALLASPSLMALSPEAEVAVAQYKAAQKAKKENKHYSSGALLADCTRLTIGALSLIGSYYSGRAAYNYGCIVKADTENSGLRGFFNSFWANVDEADYKKELVKNTAKAVGYGTLSAVTGSFGLSMVIRATARMAKNA